jgi:hypothetical protein
MKLFYFYLDTFCLVSLKGTVTLEKNLECFDSSMLAQELVSMYGYLASEASVDPAFKYKLQTLQNEQSQEPFLIVPLTHTRFAFATPAQCICSDPTLSQLMDRKNGGLLLNLKTCFSVKDAVRDFTKLGVPASPSYLQLLERLFNLAENDIMGHSRAAVSDKDKGVQRSKSNRHMAFELLAAIGKKL